MALNWTMLDAHGGNPVPLPEERIISSESGTEVTIRTHDVPPEGDALGGGSGGQEKVLKAVGNVWITTQRFIFIPTSHHEDIQSLSVPHLSILSTSFVQPFFSANYLALSIFPTPGGGLSPGTMVEVRFKDRGMFAWVGMLESARERAISKRRDERQGDPLPLYVPPPEALDSPITSDTQSATTPATVSTDGLPGYSA